jgi:hypothetical protein
LRITFANNYTTRGGRTYKGGTTAEVNDADARSLIVRGKARRADSATAEPKSAPAETHTDEGAE